MLRGMKVFTIDAMSSNSMKSRNPHSGIHETEISKCLDTMCLDPSCNQGGCLVVIALEGNGARPSHLGKGFSNDGTMYTLNTIEQHSVCYGISRSALKGGNGSNGGMPIEKDVQPTITANGCGAIAYEVKG